MIEIREIASDDIATIMYIRSHTRQNSLSLSEMKETGITAEYLEDKLATTHKGWLARCNGTESGYIIADLAFSEIWVLAVLAQYEGCGIGRTLLDRASSYLFHSGKQRISLETPADQSLRAHKLYKAAGWTVIEKYEDSWLYTLEK